MLKSNYAFSEKKIYIAIETVDSLIFYEMWVEMFANWYFLNLEWIRQYFISDNLYTLIFDIPSIYNLMKY